MLLQDYLPAVAAWGIPHFKEHEPTEKCPAEVFNHLQLIRWVDGIPDDANLFIGRNVWRSFMNSPELRDYIQPTSPDQVSKYGLLGRVLGRYTYSDTYQSDADQFLPPDAVIVQKSAREFVWYEVTSKPLDLSKHIPFAGLGARELEPHEQPTIVRGSGVPTYLWVAKRFSFASNEYVERVTTDELVYRLPWVKLAFAIKTPKPTAEQLLRAFMSHELALVKHVQQECLDHTPHTFYSGNWHWNPLEGMWELYAACGLDTHRAE